MIQNYCDLFTDYFKRTINENYIVSDIKEQQRVYKISESGDVYTNTAYEFTILEIPNDGDEECFVENIHTIVENKRKFNNIIRQEKIKKLLKCI